jgi:hypothetical protein
LINLAVQDIWMSHSIKYLNADGYTLNGSINLDKSIFVSGSIVDLDRIRFLHGLGSLPKEKQLVKSLTRYSWKQRSYSEVLLRKV